MDQPEAKQGHSYVTGAPGELVDLFLKLIDRSPDRNPYWWYDYGQMVLGNFTAGFIPEGMDSDSAMSAVREVLESAIDAGIREDFLIKALRHHLDAFVRNRQDPAVFNRHADEMRRRMEDVIECPTALVRWREARAKVNPDYARKTDEEVIADARRTLESSVTTRHVSADDAVERWADAEEWWTISSDLLPDVVFEHWSRLNIRRDVAGE